MQISRRSALRVGAGLIPAVLACKPVFGAPPPLKVTFALNRGPYDASNIPFLLAERNGYFRQENLEVDFSLSKDASDCLHRVASNDFDFGFLDLAVLLRFAFEKPLEAPLYIFTVFDKSPSSVVTWKSSGVNKPSDLIGKTLAAVSTDGAFELFPAFLHAAGIDPAGVKLEMVLLAEREKAMLSHKSDGAIGFDSTILNRLQQGGASLSDLDFTYYSSGGLDLYSNGIVVSRKMIRTNAHSIAGVVRACAKGWRDALRSPKDAMDVLREVAPNSDIARENERFEWIRSHQIATAKALQDGMGLVDSARLNGIIKQIQIVSGSDGSLRAEQIYSSAYLPSRSDRIVQFG